MQCPFVTFSWLYFHWVLTNIRLLLDFQTTRLIQEQSPELELHTQRSQFLEENEDQSKRTYRSVELCNSALFM